MAECHGNGVPDRGNADIIDTAFDQAAKNIGSVAGDTAAGIVPHIGDHRRFGRIGCMGGQRPVDALICVEHGHQGLLAHGDEFTPELFRKGFALRRVIVGDDEDAGSHFRHIGSHEAMNNGNGQDAILALHRLYAVDKGAHRLLACRIDADHLAVECGDHRFDPAFQRIQREIDHMLAAFVEIRVRKFEEGCENIQVFDPLRGEVAMRIELAGDQNIGPDDGAHAFQKIALAIVIALRDHGAMQAENDCIDRQSGLQLIQNFITQFLESLPL